MLNLQREDIRIQLPQFEGPLDLLLYLIKKEEIDIFNIPLERITTQYLECLEVIKSIDLDVASEFLVMAATLIYIKSQVLLPEEERLPDEKDIEHDPRWELLCQLIEYRKFKEAAAELHLREIEYEGVFERRARSPFVDLSKRTKENLCLSDLITAYNKVLLRTISREENTREIFEDRWTVNDKIFFLKRFFLQRSQAAFSELFSDSTSKTEVVVTFLALLELIRLRYLAVRQRNPFEEIVIYSLQKQKDAHDT